jgi:hypothetical protein
MSMKTKGKIFFIAGLFMAAFPSVSHASVQITEIMYDLEGSDTGREWVEVTNRGDSAVDISAFRLFEGGVNHRLTSVQGTTVLSAGASAIIADDTTKFLADWPAFSGSLFDSSFSGGLSNTGELLTLRNGDLADEDSITYSSEWGASGDGTSLARSGSAFSAAAPTPGAYGSGQSQQTPDTTSGQTSSSTASVATQPAAEPKNITVYYKGATNAIVGADSVFAADVFGTAGRKVDNARVFWNFGDGSSAEGASVLHAYAYPGKYVVSVTGATSDYSVSERFVMTAASATVTLRTETDGTLSVLNEGSRDIDISRWIISRGSFQFRFPEGTYILAREGIRLPPTTHIPSEGDAQLLYPNGQPAAVEVPALEHFSIKAPSASKSPQASASVSSGVSASSQSMSAPAQRVQAAAVIEAVPKVTEREEKGSGALIWLAGALGVGILGAAAVMFMRTSPASATTPDEEARTYEIVE